MNVKFEIAQLEKEIAEKKTRLKELKKSEPHMPVNNYEFIEKDGQVYPGVSVFRKTSENEIFLVTNDFFGPGDDYSSPWHFFDLLPSGSKGFNPNTVSRLNK